MLSLAIVFGYMPAMPVYADGEGGGLAAKYVINKIAPNYNGSAYDIDFEQKMTADDFAHLVSVIVSGDPIAKEQFKFYYGGIRTEYAPAMALLANAQIADVVLTFDDTSDGDDNTSDDNTGDDNDQGNTSGLGAKYKSIQSSKVEDGDLKLSCEADYESEDLAHVSKLVVNGKMTQITNGNS